VAVCIGKMMEYLSGFLQQLSIVRLFNIMSLSVANITFHLFHNLFTLVDGISAFLIKVKPFGIEAD
jgi:hypothetical protein